MKNPQVDVKTVSTVIVDLAQAMNLMIEVKNESIMKELAQAISLHTALLNKTTIISSETPLDKQKEIPFEEEKVLDAPAETKSVNNKKKEDLKVFATSKNPKHLTVVKNTEKVEKPAAPIENPAIAPEKALEVNEAFELCIKKAVEILGTIKDIKNIPSEKAELIKETIAQTYSKVHPESKLKKGTEDLNKFYLNNLLPIALTDLKKSKITAPVEKTPEAPVDNTPTKADEVQAILEAADITKAEDPKITTANTETQAENTKVEEGTTTLQAPKEIAPSLTKEESFAALALLCKGIFENHFEGSKEKVITISAKKYMFADYCLELLKEIKNLTGGVDKTGVNHSTLVKLGNKPLLKLIKSWPSNQFTALSA